MTSAAMAATSGESIRRGRGHVRPRWSQMTRPGRLESRTIRSAEPGRLADVVRHEEHGELAARARSAPARRAGCRGSSRRARRTARPSAAPGCPGRGCGPARPAGACRRTARAGACGRSRPGAPCAAARRPAPGARPGAARAACSGTSTLPSTVSHGNSAGSWNIRPGSASPASVDRAAAEPVQPGDQVEQGALAAAGGADQADELARARRPATPRPGRGRRSPRARTPWSRRRARPRRSRSRGVVVVDVMAATDLGLALRLEHLVEVARGRRCP